jgi:PAS domain S-box-containing protein
MVGICAVRGAITGGYLLMPFFESLDPATSLALFRTMYESSADAILTMDGDIILDCNRTAEFMFGHTRDEINGKSFLSFSPDIQPGGQSSSEKVERLRAAALKGEPQFFEWAHTRADGTPFPAEVTLNRVAYGDKLWLQATIRDITMRRMDEDELKEAYDRISAAEKELRQQYTALAETEEMYRNPVEHSPVGVYLQQDGIIRYANPRFAEIFGYSLAEILEKPFLDLADPGSRDRMGIPAGTTGTPPAQRDLEFVGRRKDQSQVELEIFEAPMEFKGKPSFYGSLVDITERRKAEAAIRQSEATIRGLLNATWDETVLTDNDGKILTVNEAFAASAGKTANELAGTVIYELIKSGGISMRTADAMQEKDAQVPVSFEEQQGERWFTTTVYSIHDAQGVRVQVAIFRHDITCLKAAEQEIKAANEQLTAEKARLVLYAGALDNMRDCAVITRSMGEIVYVNATFEKKFGCKAADVLEKKIKEFAHEENRFNIGDTYFFDYRDTEGQGLFLGKNAYGVKLPLTVTGKGILHVNKKPTHFVFVLREKIV